MEVRRVRPDEVGPYREMRLRALREAPDAFGTTLASALARDDAEWSGMVVRSATSDDFALFVLDRGDGRLAGSAAAMANPQHQDMGVIQMWLDADLRGQGWADALLAAAEGHARGLGRTACALWVVETNEPARRFYERCGYTFTGITEMNERGLKECLMRRVLPPA